MPRYEYRNLTPLPAAASAYGQWVNWLDEQFQNKDIDHRSEVVRDVLHELYFGRPYTDPGAMSDFSTQTVVHSLDPRNATLEPEYYGDVDGARYAERKPLIWFWMMFDRSPVGLNHALGFRVRAMLAKHIFKHIGTNVKIFHGVEISFGYNLTVEDNCVIHKFVLIGPRARITYHATVLSGVRVGEHGLVGSMGVATKDVPDFHIVVGIPAKTVKVKTIAPEEAQFHVQRKTQ